MDQLKIKFSFGSIEVETSIEQTDINTILSLFIIQKLNKMEQVSEQQFNDVMTNIDTETNRVAAELLDIKDQLRKYGLPAETEVNIFNRLTNLANNLQKVGKTDVGSPATEGSPATTGSPATDGTVSPATDIV